MKIISLVNYKGGVSKTTTAFNIAGILAIKGKKVLVMDCDAQGNMTNAFGIDNSAADFIGMDRIFDKKDISPMEIVIKKPISVMPSIDVLPSNKSLDATEMSLVNRTNRELILKKYLKKYEDFFSQYDYLLMDTSPRFSIVNINVYCVSDEIILVSDIDTNAYLGCLSVLETWESITTDLDIPNNIHGLIISRYDKRIKLSSEFVELVQSNEQLNNLLFKSIIPENIKVRESIIAGVPLVYFDNKSVAIDAYMHLYDEMAKRGVM